MSPQDTIFALSTGRPPAAISIVRVSGPRAHDAARRIAGPLPRKRVAALRELRHPASGQLLDEGIVIRFDQPASSTGEDLVEFHCHGGRAVVDALLNGLGDIRGLRPAVPGEFTRRAFENGRLDLTEAEGLADLIEAETESQRKAALVVAEGGLKRQIELWREQVLTLSAIAERAIDYDEDGEAVDPGVSEACAELGRDLAGFLSRPRVEPLKEGILVVVSGPPNAGKSSLINAIVGTDKAIVTEIPGTTRDSIEVPISLRGVPVRLTDTAGLRATSDAVEAIGVERAQKLMEAADVLLWLGPADLAPLHPRLILVHPKSDLEAVRECAQQSYPVSSLTLAGISELLAKVEELAKSVLPADDQISLNRRQSALVSEAHDSLITAASAGDLALCAEGLRQARSALDRLTGRAGLDDLLDVLFSRFCLGK